MNKNDYLLPITAWSEDDKPREKLLNKGRRVLTNAELIAILIGSGNKDETAVDLSKRILSSVDNKLHALGKMSIKKLMKFKGIGEAKAVSIIAGLELGKRRSQEELPKLFKITNSMDVFSIMHPIIGELEHEEFWVLYLNNSNKVLRKTRISSGGKTGTIVDVRIVFKEALEAGATAIILAHNHPSGSMTPSKSDKLITQKIKEAGTTLDINLLDHLIISEKTYFSFADKLLL
ncbi:RadC family protein [Aquimarina rhabdastrellae]